MRGFDIFMQVAKQICDANPDVVVLVIGAEKVVCGRDLKYIKVGRSFHVVGQLYLRESSLQELPE